MKNKFLLVALNAKYIHTNPAIHSLRSFAGQYKDRIHLVEYTINNHIDDIIRGIYKEQADVIGFSCYIWNFDMITRIIRELKKVMPHVKIWFGGPEVSYNPEECLNNYEELDGIALGEGEQTFLELVEYYLGTGQDLSKVRGIAYKKSALIGKEEECSKEVTITGFREPMNLDKLPFLYEDISELKNKIIYYESSKGCPFSCSYCLSSVDRKVRLRSLDLVKKELKLFLDHKVPQVKFVDRTFNCNKEHAMAIWQFIKENDNGITNFHFEISADLLTEEELELLGSLRPGQVQFEIGIQSTNPKTIEAINRKMDLDKLAANVEKIKEKHNIHQHLDLIAGLPYEDFDSFGKSFNDVYKLRPDQLQLGFLKVLKGSPIEKDKEKFGIVHLDMPPYEVLYTNCLSFDEIIKLKGICEMVEVYYNSSQFDYSMEYLVKKFDTPFDLYKALSEYYVENSLDNINHTRLRRFEILMDFYKEKVSDSIEIFGEILYLDLCLRENIKIRPEYAPKEVDYNTFRGLCDAHGVNRKFARVEHFSMDILASAKAGQAVGKEQYLLFDYKDRDPLSHSAKLITCSHKI